MIKKKKDNEARCINCHVNYCPVIHTLYNMYEGITYNVFFGRDTFPYIYLPPP